MEERKSAYDWFTAQLLKSIPKKRKRKPQVGNTYAKFVGNLLKTDSQIRNLPNRERLKAAAAKWKEHKKLQNEENKAPEPTPPPVTIAVTPSIASKEKKNKTHPPATDENKDEPDEPSAKRIKI